MSAEPVTSIAPPPSLILLADGLVLQSPSGASRHLTADDILAGGAQEALLWANLLVQKDLVEGQRLMAHAVTELARALSDLTRRASQPPPNPQEMMRAAMTVAQDMIKELKLKV